MINTAKEVVLSTEALDRLKLMLAPAAQRIIILSHTNPDGDAVGSGVVTKING